MHDAIAALPGSGATHPGTTLTVAGDGTQLDFPGRTGPSPQGAQGREFHWWVDHFAVVEHLHRCDAAVLPSHHEPFGIVALEVGILAPCWSPRPSGPSEASSTVSPGTSFLPRNLAALATPRCTVLADLAAAQTRALAARDRLTSDFSWMTVADHTAQVYLAAKRAERQPQPRC